MIDIYSVRVRDKTNLCLCKTFYFDNREEAITFLNYNWYNLELISINKLLVSHEEYKKLIGKEVGESD